MIEDYLKKESDVINQMTFEEMCNCFKEFPVGHKYFDCTHPFSKIFMDRFDALGGFREGSNRKCLSEKSLKLLGWKSK